MLAQQVPTSILKFGWHAVGIGFGAGYTSYMHILIWITPRLLIAFFLLCLYERRPVQVQFKMPMPAVGVAAAFPLETQG